MTYCVGDRVRGRFSGRLFTVIGVDKSTLWLKQDYTGMRITLRAESVVPAPEEWHVGEVRQHRFSGSSWRVVHIWPDGMAMVIGESVLTNPYPYRTVEPRYRCFYVKGEQ